MKRKMILLNVWSFGLMAMLAILLSTQTQAFSKSNWIPIYDSRINRMMQDLTKTDIELVRTKALPKAQKFFKDEATPVWFSVIGMAQGAFTRKASVQKAFLYRYEETGHNLATNGIAVFEKGKLVAHFYYHGGWEHGIIALPDLNNDGRNEIALEGGSTNQGYSIGYIFILELAPKNVKRFGILDIYFNNEGTLEKDKHKEAFAVLARSDKTPQFQGQKYIFGQSKWRRIGKPAILKIRDDQCDYSLVE